MGRGIPVEHTTASRRLTGALADATGRSDEEVRLGLLVAMLTAALLAVVRLVRFVTDLGSDVLSRSRR
jgi:hypothetical protein